MLATRSLASYRTRALAAASSTRTTARTSSALGPSGSEPAAGGEQRPDPERLQRELLGEQPVPPPPEAMDPKHRTTVQVPAVEVIEGEDNEPGSSTMGTILGAAGGTALMGGLAAAAALGAPIAAAAAAVGGIVGAVAGGAVGKEVPRGVDIDSAMEFDQPSVRAAGREQERQDAVEDVVSGGEGGVAGQGRVVGKREQERGAGSRELGEHEVADIRQDSHK